MSIVLRERSSFHAVLRRRRGLNRRLCHWRCECGVGPGEGRGFWCWSGESVWRFTARGLPDYRWWSRWERTCGFYLFRWDGLLDKSLVTTLGGCCTGYRTSFWGLGGGGTKTGGGSFRWKACFSGWTWRSRGRSRIRGRAGGHRHRFSRARGGFVLLLHSGGWRSATAIDCCLQNPSFLLSDNPFPLLSALPQFGVPVPLVDFKQPRRNTHGAAWSLTGEVSQRAGQELHRLDPTSSTRLQRVGAG